MTTIRVLFLTNDSEYCHRVAPYLAKYHPEIKPAFSAATQGISEALAKKMYNVVLIGEEFAEYHINVPSGVSGAYLSETDSESEINGLNAVCKYKSGEALYRLILSMFAEVSNIQSVNSSGFQIYAFAGANGGAGATTMAAAFAYRQASLGKKTLYFSCDPFADYSAFLSDKTEGGSLSDLIFIVKSSAGSKGASLKTAALLKNDVSGVRFLESCKDPYDFEVLTAEQIEKMLDILSAADEFDCVVIDASIYDERCRKLIMKRADTLFIVAENDNSARAKLKRLMYYLNVADNRGNTDLVSRSMLIFNKNAEQNFAEVDGIAFCGSVPKYKDRNIRNIANAAARLDIWNCIQTN